MLAGFFWAFAVTNFFFSFSNRTFTPGSRPLVEQPGDHRGAEGHQPAQLAQPGQQPHQGHGQPQPGERPYTYLKAGIRGRCKNSLFPFLLLKKGNSFGRGGWMGMTKMKYI